jgi:hypothetical protein
VFEADLAHNVVLHSNDVAQSIQGDTALRAELNCILPSLRLNAQAVKLQLARRGGAFPMHHDAAGWPDTRVLSAILYLNSDWREGDGGELRLYPFPFDSFDVQPLEDRLVIFSSECMLHRVLALQSHRRQCSAPWRARVRVHARARMCACVRARACVRVCVCVRGCARARVRACVFVFVRVRVRERACVHVRACVRVWPRSQPCLCRPPGSRRTVPLGTVRAGTAARCGSTPIAHAPLSARAMARWTVMSVKRTTARVRAGPAGMRAVRVNHSCRAGVGRDREAAPTAHGGQSARVGRNAQRAAPPSEPVRFRLPFARRRRVRARVYCVRVRVRAYALVRHIACLRAPDAEPCSVAYAQQWADSIVESHNAGDDADALLEDHWKTVRVRTYPARHYRPRPPAV